jgi:hypothetical protein
MEKVNLQEGNEALKRALLLMKYDLKKTLTENVESRENIDEQSWAQIGKGATAGATTGAAVGTVFGVVGAVPGAIVGGLLGAASAAFGNERYETAKKLFQACKSNKFKPTLSIDELDMIGDQINRAVEGLGTDEDAIAEALSQLPTIPDLCGVIKAYGEVHGDLFSDLDGDLDSDTEWKNYVLVPLRRAMRKSQELSKQAPKTDDIKTFKSFIVADWGNEITGKETYKKEGEFFIVNDGSDDYRYKKQGKTFIFVD